MSPPLWVAKERDTEDSTHPTDDGAAPRALRQRFDARAQAVPAARSALAGLCGPGEEGLFRDAVLCLSELMTEAVRRSGDGGAVLELEVDVSGDALRVSVSDATHAEEERAPEQIGLVIVDRLSDRWGVDRGERDATWFEIDRTATALRRKAMLFRHMSDAAVVLGPDRRIVDWNPAAGAALRLPDRGGRSAARRSSSSSPTGRLEDVDPPPPHPLEVAFLRAQGSIGVCELTAVPLSDERAAIHGLTLLARDLTERRRAEVALLRAEEKFRRVVEGAPDAIVGVTAAGAIALVNQRAERMLGYRREELLGKPVDLLWPDRLRQDYTARVGGQASPQAEPVGEVFARRRDGTGFPAELWVNTVHTDEGPLTLCSARDVSERARLERRLEYLAEHDELTGLLNRRGFNRELGRWLAYASRYGGEGAALMVDLDGFKHVNDTFGHRTGDLYLATVANALRRRLRATDILARLGGDEFAVLLPQVDAAKAEQVAVELKEAIEESSAGDQAVDVTASIGVAAFRGGNVPPTELIETADRALYRAKAAGRDCVVVLGSEGGPAR